MQKQEQITVMFDKIARTYDSLNYLLSFGQERRWRKALVSHFPKTNAKILDVATGTADVLIEAARAMPTLNDAYGVDLAGEMLAVGQKKLKSLNLEHKIHLQKADAASLPFKDQSFDVVSISFGIRNVVNIDEALREFARVLKPQGQLFILEFSWPKNKLLKWFYSLYFKYVLPNVGAWLSKDKEAYRYLNRSVESFPYSQKFCRIIENAGFMEVYERPLSFGVATIYQGKVKC